MKSGFKEMVEDSPDIQITLDREDPNASRSEIVVRSDAKFKSLVRKSDISGGIVDLQYRPNILVESEAQDSPISFGNNPDFESKIIGDKEDKHELGSDIDQFQYEEQTSSLDNNLPIVNYFIPLSMTVASIIEVFNETWKQQNFKVIEYEAGNATAVFKAPFSLKKIIFKWIPIFGEDDEESVSAIRVILSVDESKGCRKVTIKGLYGNVVVLKSFIKFFNRKIKSCINKEISNDNKNLFNNAIKTKSSNNFNELITHSSNKEENKNDQSFDDIDESSNKFTYYYYHKIMSSDQYSLGK